MIALACFCAGIVALAVILHKDKSLAIQLGFMSDVQSYIDLINDTTEVSVLDQVEKAVKFLDEYKRHVRPEVIERYKAEIMAAIMNRKKVLESINSFIASKLILN